jgi:hypothetical protein
MALDGTRKESGKEYVLAIVYLYMLEPEQCGLYFGDESNNCYCRPTEDNKLKFGMLVLFTYDCYSKLMFPRQC